ncbi:MAG: DUF1361 domain-containing protein [Runella sp.]
MKIKSIFLLALLSVVSVGMVLGRNIATQDPWGQFLVWNLFLAWLPLGFSYTASWIYYRHTTYRWLCWLLAGAWLAFFPNAPYLITDLMHLKSSPNHLIWYDALMNFSFALAGLLTGLYSILLIHRLIEKLWGNTFAWLMVTISLVLSSYGVYLGRFGRWNSWDIITHPNALFRYIWHSVQTPLAQQLTLSFSFAMLLIYFAFWFFVRYRSVLK